eukprot:6208122-Pleurochrysis_carterae.AAC.3
MRQQAPSRVPYHASAAAEHVRDDAISCRHGTDTCTAVFSDSVEAQDESSIRCWGASDTS